MTVSGARPVPTLSAVVLDARASDAPLASLPAGAPRAHGARSTTVASAQADVRFVTLPARGTREMIEAARGADVVVVVAGPHVSAVARAARIAVAAGARAAVIAVPPGCRDVDERSARYLVTGLGADLAGGDDALSGSTEDSVADLVARAAAPIFHDGFLAVARVAGARRAPAPFWGRVIHGPMPARAEAHVLWPEGFLRRSVVVTHGERFTSFDLGDHPFENGDELVIASEPLPSARRFVVEPDGASVGIEPCIAFGGNGGFGHARFGGGVVEVDRPICPNQGRVGVVLLKGAGLGPVRVLHVRSTRTEGGLGV